MKIQSQAFQDHQPIPKKFTCDGEDVSPELSWSEIPAGTESLVLIMDDPDAPMGTFDHWIMWNIPADTKNLAEGAVAGLQGTNGFGKQKYGGPCPPKGNPHRYFFKLYALSTKLNLKAGVSKEAVESAIEGHILQQAEVVGTYQRAP